MEALTTAMAENAKNGLGVLYNYYNDEFNAMTKTVNDNLDKQLTDINTKYDR